MILSIILKSKNGRERIETLLSNFLHPRTLLPLHKTTPKPQRKKKNPFFNKRRIQYYTFKNERNPNTFYDPFSPPPPQVPSNNEMCEKWQFFSIYASRMLLCLTKSCQQPFPRFDQSPTPPPSALLHCSLKKNCYSLWIWLNRLYKISDLISLKNYMFYSYILL